MTSKPSASTLLLRTALGYFIRLTAVGFLTNIVISVFGALVSIYIIVFGSDLSSFPMISILIPSGDINLDENDVMRIFGFGSTIFFLISLLWRFIIYWIGRGSREADGEIEGGNVPSTPSIGAQYKRRLLINGGIVIGTYTVLALVIPFADVAEGNTFWDFFPVLFFLCGFGFISAIMYVAIDLLASRISPTFTEMIQLFR